MVAKSTISQIHGLLGSPKNQEIGFSTSGAVLGQIVTTMEHGGERYTPKMIEFVATVEETDGQKSWQIQTKTIG